MTKILVIGGEGQLGRELAKYHGNILCTNHRIGSPEFLDIRDEEAVTEIVKRYSPDIIVNAAAATNVDKCEDEKEMAYTTNGLAVRNVINAARRKGSKLIHISTDYIFDGKKGNYSENDFPNPVNYYGLSKLVGDVFAQSYEKSLIVRTSGVYGNKRNFPYYVLNRLKTGGTMDIIDGIYSPIHASNLARAVISLSELDIKGIINVAGDGISRIEFARNIARAFDLDESLLVEVEKFKSMKAERPYDSSLNITKAAGLIGFDFHSIESNMEYFKDSYSKIE